MAAPRSSMSLHPLACHPATPSTAVERVEVELERAGRGVALTYRLHGDAARIVAAAPAPSEPARRRDGLWQSTCCELFVRDAQGDGYREYNFAPCGDWAAYRFSAYRAGCVPLDTPAPRIVLERSADSITLVVTLPDSLLDAAGRIGLGCVVETDAERSYWALAHPPGKPDFHHASAFALTLAAAVDSAA